MITNIVVRLSSQNPAKPLTPVAVLKGSAATITVIGAPARCSTVTIKATNAIGTVQTYAATVDSQGWTATIPATHFADAGFAERGFQVWGGGNDETNTARVWGLGEGDLEVLPTDGTTGTVGNYTTVKVQAGTPGAALLEELRKIGGVWKIYHNGAWDTFGGGVSDYDALTSRPQIGGVTLTGNKSLGELGAASETSLTAHTGATNNPHAVTKSQVGLGNCDNTSDANKPISTATQNALNGKAGKTNPSMTGWINLQGEGSNAPGIYVGAAWVSVEDGCITINGKQAASMGDIPYYHSTSPDDRMVAYYKVVADTDLPIVLPEIPAFQQYGDNPIINLDIVIDTIGVTTLPDITINGATVGGAKQTIYASGAATPEIKANSINVIDCTSIPALRAWMMMGATELTAVNQG